MIIPKSSPLSRRRRRQAPQSHIQAQLPQSSFRQHSPTIRLFSMGNRTAESIFRLREYGLFPPKNICLICLNSGISVIDFPTLRAVGLQKKHFHPVLFHGRSVPGEPQRIACPQSAEVLRSLPAQEGRKPCTVCPGHRVLDDLSSAMPHAPRPSQSCSLKKRPSVPLEQMRILLHRYYLFLSRHVLPIQSSATDHHRLRAMHTRRMAPSLQGNYQISL